MSGQQFSASERQFNRRWRELIGKVGGQKMAIRRLGWSKSTVSRDFTGDTLPSDERIRRLGEYLDLGQAGRAELLDLLEAARGARVARKHDAGYVFRNFKGHTLCLTATDSAAPGPALELLRLRQ